MYSELNEKILNVFCLPPEPELPNFPLITIAVRDMLQCLKIKNHWSILAINKIRNFRIMKKMIMKMMWMKLNKMEIVNWWLENLVTILENRQYYLTMLYLLILKHNHIVLWFSRKLKFHIHFVPIWFRLALSIKEF